MKKIYLSIVHFQNNDKHYLNEIISEYNKYPFTVDINIHTNKRKIKDLDVSLFTNGEVNIIKENLLSKFLLYRNKNYYLTWTPRKRIKKNIENYDIFIYSEDDILIPLEAFNYWYKNKNTLFSKKYLPGFILLEVDDSGNEIAVNFNKNKLTKTKKIDNSEFYVNDNVRYTACWVYDKKMMVQWINSGLFDIRKISTKKALRSNLLDNIKIQNINIRYWLYNLKNKKGYGIRENSAIGMNSENNNLVRDILFLKNNNGLDNAIKIYHLSNKYYKSNVKDIGKVLYKDLVDE
jgi:hypothetical protein